MNSLLAHIRSLSDAEARRFLNAADGQPDLPWAQLPPPPAPSGFDQIPPTPAFQTIALKNIDHSKWIDESSGVRMEYDAHDITGWVEGRWLSVVAATVTQQVGFKRSVSVMVGASETDMFGVGLSISLGVSIEGVGELGTQLSLMYQHSQTIERSTTTMEEFDFQGTPSTPRVTGWGWQADFKYNLLLRRVLISVNGGNPTLKNNVPYTMPSGSRIFSTTQYPPVR